MTYTVLVAHPETGALAVASASFSLALGNAVPRLTPGVGVVASQALTNRSLRRLAIESLERGLSPSAVMAELSAADEEFDRRQVGVVDATGRWAAHTGGRCLDWAGSASAPGVLAIGNLLTGECVVEAIVETYLALPRAADSVALADNAIRALEAGLAVGGDRRGQQSAVVLAMHGGLADADLEVDLRVDDHERPLLELRRLVELAGEPARTTSLRATR